MKRFPHTAVILANGPTVLDGLQVSAHPKPMLPIADRSLVEYQASVLASAGVESLIICVGSNSGNLVDELPKILARLPLAVRCVLQETPRGTGGTLKELESLIRGERFWVMSGDLLTDADLSLMADFHHKCGATATVAVVREEDPPWRMERVEYDAGEHVKAIHRIHPAHSRRSMLRPVGLYLFERNILDRIPQEGYFDLKEQLFSLLYDDSVPSRVWENKGYCQTITSIDRYFATNRDILLGRAEFSYLRHWAPRNPSDILADGGSSALTVVGPVALGHGATVGKGVLLIGPTTICEGCVIGSGAVLNNCILLKNSRIGSGARLTNCIVGEDSVVGDGADLRDAWVLCVDATSESVPVTSDPGNISPSSGTSCCRDRDRKGYRLWKRLFDSIFSLSALIFLAPFLIVIAIAIKLDSRGSVIFRQRRCGMNGKEFTMLKFRTMVDNAEEAKREVQRMNEVDGPMFKVATDPRVTRIGSILRATNLDEVPQFWNILRGDMALIGPRPLSWDEMRYNPRWRDIRLSVPQGLLGLWQIQSHTNTAFVKWIHNDLAYVYERSAWQDFKILMIAHKNMLFSLLRPLMPLVHRESSVRHGG